MKKGAKKIVYALLILGTVLVVGTMTVNLFLKNKLADFINHRLPAHMVRSFETISVGIWDGSITLSKATLVLKNKGNGIAHTKFNVEKLTVTDISYWEYILHEEIHVENITLENPTITYYEDRVNKTDDTTRQGLFNIYKPIIIDKLAINNTRLAIFEKGKDSTKLYTNGLSVELDGIRIDKNTISLKIPLEYAAYKAQSDTVFVKVSPYENLTAHGFSIENRTAFFKKLSLKTKYSKRELSRLIGTERDHYDLSVGSLTISGIDFGFNKNRFFAKSKKVHLSKPSLEIYRDKLVADDPTTKPLYSKMLRDLPFALTVDSLEIVDGAINYEERQNAENMGGSINFENFNATIANIGNTYTSPTMTEINITSHFMENTPLSVHWNFDVQNTADQFQFKAEVGHLVADRLNSFTEPNLNVMLTGNTNRTYFTIDANNTSSTIAMKINYSDFKVTLLQKDGKGKNRFLSAIANIFISKNSERHNEYYKEGNATATRNKTKSVFNYLWLNVKEALIKILL